MSEFNYWEFDKTFADPFSLVLKEKVKSAKNILSKAVEIISENAPGLAEISKLNNKEIKYTVDFTSGQIADIENGVQKLFTTKDGRVLAQFVNNGKFGERVGIIREVTNEFNFEKLYAAMSMVSMQNELRAISEQLNVLDSHISKILDGQHNDRISVYYNGVSMLLEARKLSDKALKNTVISQALSALGESFFKLSLEMKSDINYLINKEYKKEKEASTKIIDRTMTKIDNEFAAIHQAALLRAAIYCEAGELSSMTESLTAYSQFIEKVIATNAPKLIEYDKYDRGMSDSKWNARASLTLDVSPLQQLMTKNEEMGELL